MAPEATRPGRRTMTGTVVSDKMQKTVVVAVESIRRHPLYGRTVRRTKRYKAHDPEQQAHVGDRVVIAESRPFSRDKRWRVAEVLRRGAAPVELAEEVQV
ncbi:MAG: 30S ribosomal protein S17 [Chloroflexi bacterium]|nr:30S ribosomal protein S17 [Chloroflexota bacterium]